MNSLADPGKQTIELREKLNFALLLAMVLWTFDHSLTYLSEFANGATLNQQRVILLAIFLTGVLAPFWLSAYLFNRFPWTATIHSAGDRVLAALLGVILQLAFDLYVLSWISPGKVWMTGIYAFSCSLGALKNFRPAQPAASGAEYQQALKTIRFRLTAVWTLAVLFLYGARAALQTGRLTNRGFVSLFFALLAVLLLQKVFAFSHGRCPKCGARLRTSKYVCTRCSQASA